MADAAVIQGSALGVAEARKQALHTTACHQVGVGFFPVAVEVLGGWSPTACSIICSIGRRLGQRLGRDPSETSRHLFQQLSVTLWRGNAAMWCARQLPLTLPLTVLYEGSSPSSLVSFIYFYYFLGHFLMIGL